MRNSLLFAVALFCMIPTAFAQMDADFSLGGAIRVGASTTTCDAAATGGIRYSGGFIQWCNGTAWANIASGGGGTIDGLTDAYTDYGASSNFIMGRTSAAALTAGAQFNTFLGESAGATTANSTATTDHNTAVGYGVLTALTSGIYNTAVGSRALETTTSGQYNTVLGYKAMRLNTTGGFNQAIGGFALEANTTGSNNIAVGDSALSMNTVANGNVAIGNDALLSNVAKQESTAVGFEAMRYADSTAVVATSYNTALGAYALRGSATASANTGTANTALGHSAMQGNTTGNYNAAVGTQALYANTTGSYNTAVGERNMFANTTGADNTAIGQRALTGNTTGNYNIALGGSALYSNVAKSESTAVGFNAMYYADSSAVAATTYNTAVGAYALRGSTTASANTGTNNTAIGHSALLSNTTGGANTAVGYSALYSNTTGGGSVALGNNALYLATGGANTAVGYNAGNSITTGTGNIVIGYDVDAPTATTSNHLNIGNTIYGDLSTDKVGIGVVSPASALDVNGGVKIANDADACVAGKAGTLRYTGGTPPWEYCNGSAWSPFNSAGCSGPADCSTVGSVCTDGSVFAGCVPPTFVTPFFATRCDAGQTWGGASCTGTRTATLQWNNGNSTGNILTNINDYIDGEANTTALQVGGAQQDSDSGVAGVQPHQAADYCATLNIHGKTDWYLPSRAELYQMCINSTTIGNFGNGAYWTSTETTTSTAAYQFIGSSCDQSSVAKSSGANEYVRCVRK